MGHTQILRQCTMQKQVVDNLLIESLVSTTNLESLVRGYILNCRTEGKSPKTISGYEMTLRNFAWYCRRNEFPEIQRLTAVHIKHFLWYLASESHRWDSNSPAAKRQVTSTTVNSYFRALRTFFNWLEREDLIGFLLRLFSLSVIWSLESGKCHLTTPGGVWRLSPPGNLTRAGGLV